MELRPGRDPILNNTVKTANRIFSAGGCDVEAFVLKVYSEFSSAKKVEMLKEFTNTQYKDILRHVHTVFAASNSEDFRVLASSKVLFCVSRTGGLPKYHLGICVWCN